MARWLITGSLLLLAVVGSLIYVAKPEIIERNIRDIRAPMDRIIAERNIKKWTEAKEQAHASWRVMHPTTQDCINPGTALKETECRNLADMHEDEFERNWHQRIASGWHHD